MVNVEEYEDIIPESHVSLRWLAYRTEILKEIKEKTSDQEIIDLVDKAFKAGPKDPEAIGVLSRYATHIHEVNLRKKELEQ